MVPSRQLEMRPSGQLASPVMTGATLCRALFNTSLKKLYPAHPMHTTHCPLSAVKPHKHARQMLSIENRSFKPLAGPGTSGTNKTFSASCMQLHPRLPLLTSAKGVGYE